MLCTPPSTGLHDPLSRSLVRELAGLGSDTRWLFFFLKGLGWVEIKALRNEVFSLEILNCVLFWEGVGRGLGEVSECERLWLARFDRSPGRPMGRASVLAGETITLQLCLKGWSMLGFVCSKRGHIP